MLEDHVINFIRRWHFPLGFFGEQGGESIHHEIVEFANDFHHVHPATDRLKGMLERHYTVVEPENREIIAEETAQPEAQKMTFNKIYSTSIGACQCQLSAN